MAAPVFTKSRYRTILLIIASVLVVGGAAAGTIVLLKQFGPARITDSVSEPTADTSLPLEKAEDLFAKGDYAGAKTQYQSVLDTYKSQNNDAGVKDVEMQLKIIDATASAQQAPQNTDRNRIQAGPQPE